ncbi:putative Hedgehog signaling attenuator pxb [Lycorma delicatula]|uniref:putative Hedgehog signaling attenuator pxb n=1 Tax=Lycorma delicatula TaxID=130591 RepID=UPI003F51A47C
MGGTDSPLPALWDMDSADYECDCPGPPPPAFHLPPPPRPPFLHELADCSEAPLLDLETCDTMPVIDAEYHSSPAIPSLALIVVCSVLLLAMLLLATVLVWKHKKKMQNFLPCKSSPQNRCDVTHGNGVIYEDLTNIRPRPLPQPSMEMLDVKSRAGYPNNCNYPVISHSPVFICPPPRPEQYSSQDLYNPVYEELSNGSGERGESDAESEGVPQAPLSEDEFAEDELSLGEQGAPGPTHSGTSSLQGSTGNDLCRDIDSSDADDRSRFLCGRNLSLPPNQRGPRSHRAQRPRSLDRRRGTHWRGKAPSAPPECGEFHEGLLLDALLQLYPGGSQPDHHRMPYILPVPNPPPSHVVNPYESVPVLHRHHIPTNRQDLTTFRPSKQVSQDSDSGYSHNTSGGRASTRGRKDPHMHRLPTHSSDLVLS